MTPPGGPRPGKGPAPHGITLFDHAQIAAEMAEGDRPFAEILEARGLTETQWNESTLHWMTRMGDDVMENAENARIPTVYSEAFGAAQAAQKPVRDMTPEGWAELLVDIQRAGSPSKPLATRGLSQADYLRLSRRFAAWLSSDSDASAAFFARYQELHPPPNKDAG